MATSNNANENDSSLVKGNLWKAIFRLASPMILGIVAVFSVSIVDTYFVGKLGTNQLAALSFTFPVTMAIASLASGLGAGAASVVSRRIGADDKKKAKRLASDSLVLASTIVLIISIIGFLTIEPLFSLLGANNDTLAHIYDYMSIWYISMPFLVIPIVANSIIRSVGNALWPSVIMLIAAFINILLTPLFIFGWSFIPALEIQGAAISTSIARVFTFFLALYVAIYREKIIVLCLPSIQDFVESSREVLKIALPAGSGSVINPIGIAIVTAALASYGSQTVAAFGVATRIESFACIPMLALSASIGPIAGQNWGANNKHRVLQAVKYCYCLCVIWTVLVGLAFTFSAGFFTNLLASNSEVASIAQNYLLIVSFSLLGYGFVIVSSATFNSLGKSITGLSYYLVRTFAFYVPLSTLAALWFNDQFVYIAIAISNLVSGVLVAVYTLWWLKKAKHSDCTPNWRLQTNCDQN